MAGSGRVAGQNEMLINLAGQFYLSQLYRVWGMKPDPLHLDLHGHSTGQLLLILLLLLIIILSTCVHLLIDFFDYNGCQRPRRRAATLVGFQAPFQHR